MPYTKELSISDESTFDNEFLSLRKHDNYADSNYDEVKRHSYKNTRKNHTEEEPCESPYCGMCYDDFREDYTTEKEIALEAGYIYKLTQTSIRKLEDKYGLTAFHIFRNRFSKFKSEQRKRKLKELIKSGIDNCPNPFDENHIHSQQCIKKIINN